jgi:DNA-cytosine methyltransferase
MNVALTQKQYTIAEFFAGCGGFSHGFSRTRRFCPVLGNDIKKFALETFRVNHTRNGVGPITIDQDIRSISDGKLISLLRERVAGNVDCLLGGPPCQGFSQMRRTEARKGSKIVRFGGYNKLDQDPRNDLVLRFLEVAAVLNPKVIVIENVPQFLSHYHDGERGGIAQQVEVLLGDMGYETVCDVLNAADYGVPQLRQRAFILASRVGKIDFPAATHGEQGTSLGNHLKPWVSVNDAIGDLPLNPPVNDTLANSDGTYVSEPQCDFQKEMRTSTGFPYNHVTRPYQQRIIEIIKHMGPGETWDDASARMQRRFENLVSDAVNLGENPDAARKRLASEGKIISAFYKRYYWSAYTRMDPNRPALTITANANFLGSGRYTHPKCNRGITMREAARLQSFDDAFTFVTSDSDTQRTTRIGVGLDMIGEAVPPLLAKAIGESIAAHLDNTLLQE